MEPVGITFTGTSTSRFPRRMIEPLPYCFSICAIARSRFLVFSSDTLAPRGFSPAFPGDAGGTVYQNACPALNPHLYGHIITRRTKSKDYFETFCDRDSIVCSHTGGDAFPFPSVMG